MTDSSEHVDDERRLVRREYLVTYLRVFAGGSKEVLGHVVNLSPKGMMLLSSSSIPVKKEYRLHMRIPNTVGDLREMSVTGISLWSRGDENSDYHLSGFKLRRLKPAAKSDMMDILERLSYPRAKS